MRVTPDILVVGGGPAGVAAACDIAEANLSVILIDQAPKLGGVLFRNFGDNSRRLLPSDLADTWRNLSGRLTAQAARIRTELQTVFIGMDAAGVVALNNRASGKAYTLAPRAIVVATGAIEYVEPLPGWHLPKVMTAGGLQVAVKESGTPPPGDILLAGSGPLLLAAAAQLVKLGRPPVAVIEAANPPRHAFAALALPLSYLREGGSYLTAMARAGVPWLRGARLEEIHKDGGAFSVVVRRRDKLHRYRADIIALHNGLRPNNIGLPRQNLNPQKGPVVIYAGDCNEALGGRAAALSGSSAAHRLLLALGVKPATEPCRAAADIEKYRKFQKLLAEVFKACPSAEYHLPPDETILCRCEQQTVGDLSIFSARSSLSAREVKLNGRFGLGRCQGRFCAEKTRGLLLMTHRDAPTVDALIGQRWPVKPIPIKDLADLDHEES
ncbi:MAG: oxidase [Proteobacteria bacterium]|nr:MAG: oxidase [Pseudomonadota bacterium]